MVMGGVYLIRVILSATSFLLTNSGLFSQNEIIRGEVNYRKEVLQTSTFSLGNKRALTRPNPESGSPQSKLILSINYRVGKIGCILGSIRFAKTSVHNIDSSKEILSPNHLSRQQLRSMIMAQF